MLSLNPFLDKDGLIRVGGRPSNLEFGYDKKFPIVLPNKHNFTRLLVKNEHLKLLHAGPQLLLANLRQSYWIISARNIVRKIVHNCVQCFKVKPEVNVKYLMSDLPEQRAKPNKPFSNVGIDFCGPFNLRDRKTRNFVFSFRWATLYIFFRNVL